MPDLFHSDKIPTPEEIAFFLELELMKDIKIIDKKKLGATDVKHAIIATGYSSRHIYRVAKTLVKTLRQLDVEYNNLPQLFGQRDDDWYILHNQGKI